MIGSNLVRTPLRSLFNFGKRLYCSETDLNNYLKLSNETLECLNDRFSELIVALSWETPVLLTS